MRRKIGGTDPSAIPTIRLSACHHFRKTNSNEVQHAALQKYFQKEAKDKVSVRFQPNVTSYHKENGCFIPIKTNVKMRTIFSCKE